MQNWTGQFVGRCSKRSSPYRKVSCPGLNESPPKLKERFARPWTPRCKGALPGAPHLPPEFADGCNQLRLLVLELLVKPLGGSILLTEREIPEGKCLHPDFERKKPVATLIARRANFRSKFSG